MFKPEHRPEPVHHLVSGVDRYNPDVRSPEPAALKRPWDCQLIPYPIAHLQNVVVLEEYLQTQIDNGTYDHFANLALLKLCVYSEAHAVPLESESASSR